MGTILQRLKEETREHHVRAESVMRLLEPGLDPALYRQHLEALHGLYVPLEAQLERLLAGRVEGLALEQRWKRGLLAQDLQAQGHDAASLARLPQAPALPLAGVPEALGAMYVLEGATLGGQLLLRHLSRHFAAAPSPVGDFAFFRAYEDALGPMWRAFGQALVEATPDAAFADRVVHGARVTFDAFEAWMRARLAGPQCTAGRLPRSMK